MKGPGILEYRVAHNLIKSHAKAYRVYQKEFADNQKGKVGITLNVDWYEPTVFNDTSHIEVVMHLGTRNPKPENPTF